MDPEGGGSGGPEPPAPENHKYIVLPWNTDPGHPRKSKTLMFESHNMCGSRVRVDWMAGSGAPALEHHEYNGLLSGRDTLENHNPTLAHSTLGVHRPDSQASFKWRFAGGP